MMPMAGRARAVVGVRGRGLLDVDACIGDLHMHTGGTQPDDRMMARDVEVGSPQGETLHRGFASPEPVVETRERDFGFRHAAEEPGEAGARKGLHVVAGEEG